MLKRTLSVILLLSVAALALACDPSHTVTYENQTSQALTVFRFGREAFELQPYETSDYGVIEFSGQMPIEAQNSDGTVVYSTTVTWDELEQAGWQVVITDEGG